MKKILISIVLILAVTTGILFAEDAGNFKANDPILLTTFGQNPDANVINLLSKRLKLQCAYISAVKPEDIDWSKYKTVIAVIGGSGKGLGSAGLDVNSEQDRCNKLISDARNAGVPVIGMHIGGEDRRGPNSEPFLPLAEKVDYLVVKASGNADGYFTKMAEAQKIPFHSVNTTSEIQNFMKQIFF